MKRFYLGITLLLPMILSAQSQLTLKNAIDTALKNNYDIQIAKNYVKIAETGNNYGMAGGLPFISANASDNYVSNNTLQKYNTGIETNSTDIIGNNYNAALTANIVLFNGFKVLATKKQLSYLQKQSEIGLNGQIQSTIANVMMKYYDVIRQQALLKITQNSLDVSQKKLEIINVKDKVGMANAAITMQAQSDVNTATQNLTLQQLQINQAKADLLTFINAKSNTTYIFNDSIQIDPNLALDNILQFLQQNPQLQLAEQQIKINEQLLKVASAQKYPSLKLNAAYNLTGYNNNDGYNLFYQNYGPTAGLSLQLPLFNGNVYHTQKSIAKINLYNANLEKESLFSSLKNTVTNKYQTYTTTLNQIESQKQNYDLAQKLVDIVLQNFQHGQANILELKAAQTTYENAAYQLVSFQFNAKMAEIELKQLIYQLSY